MDVFLLYLFTRLDVLVGIVTAVTIFGGIALAVTVMIATIFASDGLDRPADQVSDREYSENYHNKQHLQYLLVKKIQRRLIVPVVICATLCITLPDRKDAALILAGYGILEVAKTDEAKRIASKSVQLIEQTLDGYLKEEKK